MTVEKAVISISLSLTRPNYQVVLHHKNGEIERTKERHADFDAARSWCVEHYGIDPFDHLPEWAVQSWEEREEELQPRLI